MKDEMEVKEPKAKTGNGNSGDLRGAMTFLEENHREGGVWKVEKIKRMRSEK